MKNPFELISKNKTIYIIWNIFWMAAASVGTGFCSLLLAYGPYDRQIFYDYLHQPLLVLVNILPAVLLAFLLWFASGKAWIAQLVSSLAILGLSIADFYKMYFRSDPLMFRDIFIAGTGLKAGLGYDFKLSGRPIFCVIFIIITVLFLAFFCRLKPSKSIRIIFTVAIIAVCFPLKTTYTGNAVYNGIQNFEHLNKWVATDVYVSKGFVYPFIHSIPEAFPKAPEGYSEKYVKELFEELGESDIPEDKKVDIIAIQLEAFTDLTRTGVSGIEDFVYEDYHKLIDECFSGRLVTGIFAGDTIATERSFATGFTYNNVYRKDVGSYMWYLKDQGYVTEGAHPFDQGMYNRININRYLGFDNYWYAQNRYTAITGTDRANDDVFMSDLLELYRQRDKSKPYFSMSVSYQGHGPYSTDKLKWGDGYYTGTYSDPESYYILNNYLGSIHNTIKNILKLKAGLEIEADPVVLVLFGDHMPWLGDGRSVYNDLGINLDTSTDDGFFNYYSTEYLIWANKAAKSALGCEIRGKGPDISSCYLMNVLFDILGWDYGSPFMKLTGLLMQEQPIIVNHKNTELYQKHEIAQYYLKYKYKK